MLENKDLEKIGKVVEGKIEENNKKLMGRIGGVIKNEIEENNKKLRKEFGEVIEENIMPVLDSMNKRIDSIDKRLTTVEATMVTKSYLDDKLADLEGSVIVRQRKEDKK